MGSRQTSAAALNYGFRVVAQATLPRAFVRALKILQGRGLADDSCTIVKTTVEKLSGITHGQLPQAQLCKGRLHK